MVRATPSRPYRCLSGAWRKDPAAVVTAFLDCMTSEKIRFEETFRIRRKVTEAILL